MEVMRQSWTDERLDDFRAHVDTRFDVVEQDVRELRSEMNGRFEHLGHRVDDLHRTLQRIGGGVIVALVGLIATQL